MVVRKQAGNVVTALGAWKQAPLAYVLAEVRTEHLADLKSYKAEIAALFRAEYPIQRVLHTAKFVASSGGGLQHVETEQDAAWEFAAPDNHVALIVRPNGFVLHATRYKDSTDFLGLLHRAVSMLSSKIPAIFLNRLGLRYVDFVVPRSGEVPEDYVDKRLSPMLDIGQTGGAVVAMSLVVYPFPNGQMTLRFVRGTGQPELPPELSTINLEKSPLMKRPDIAPTQATAIVDMDRVREFATRVPMDADFVRQQLQSMRNDVSDVFKNKVITDHARKIWGAT